jgi:hypothetical protein
MGQLSLSVRRLRGERVEQFSRSEAFFASLGAVPLSRETGFSPWEEGHDTKVVLRDSRYGL